MKTKRWIYYLFILMVLFSTGCDNSRHITHGYVEGDFTYIAVQTTGLLHTIKVAPGDFIQKDQLLFIVDAEPQISEVNRAKANLRQAKANLANLEKGKRPSEIAALKAKEQQILAQLAFSEKTVDRYKRLVHKAVLDQSQLDKAVAEHDHLKAAHDESIEQLKTAGLEARSDEIAAARAAVSAAEATLKQAKWHLAQKEVYAPITGEIFDVYYNLGELVSINHPVLSMLSSENVYIVFFVPERLLASIAPKQKISILCDHCPKPIMASIRFISPKAEFTPPVIYSEKTRVNLIYRVEAELSREDARKMHPGQPVTVKLG